MAQKVIIHIDKTTRDMINHSMKEAGNRLLQVAGYINSPGFAEMMLHMSNMIGSTLGQIQWGMDDGQSKEGRDS